MPSTFIGRLTGGIGSANSVRICIPCACGRRRTGSHIVATGKPLSRSPCDGFNGEYGVRARNLTLATAEVARILFGSLLRKLVALQFRRVCLLRLRVLGAGWHLR